MPDLRLTWADYPGGYGTQVAGPQTIDAGGVAVTVDVINDIESSVAFALNLPSFDDPADDLPPDSQLKLIGDSGTAGVNGTSTTVLSFASTDPLFGDSVADLSFRIDDIDAGFVNDVDASDVTSNPHVDIVNIRAFDTLGNEIPVTITPGGGMTQAGQTLTGSTQGLATDGAQSALIEIAGPVGRVEIDYDNGETGSQEIFVSDLLFTTTDPVPAADPIATDDTATTPIDTLIEDIDVLGNDTDPNGDIVTLVAGSATSADGIVTENPDGTLNFDPIPGFTGDAIVTYDIEDGNGGTDTGTLTVTVTPAGGNSAPTAVDDGPIDAESGVLFDDIFVVGNDFDPDGDPFTVTLASAPNGTVTVNPDGTLNYTSDAGFVGQDTITYTIDDVISGTDTATVLVNVAAGPNGPPVAEDDAATTPFDTLIEDIDVLGNDTDPDGDPVTLVPVSATSADGTVTENPDGTLNFDPTPGFTGDAIVTYDIEDGNGGTDTGTLTVTVTPAAPNDDPIAANDAVIAMTDVLVEDIDVLGNDSDPDGDPLTVTAATSDNGGTVTINPDGTLDYTSPLGFEGTDLIRYTIEDGNGGSDEGIVRVSVRDDAPGNQAPTAVDDTATTPADTLLEDIDVLGNDTDPEGDPLTVTGATAPNGTVTINPDGTLDYQPDPGFSGPDTISYIISDGNGNTDIGSVAVTVGDPNDPPVAVDDTTSGTTAEPIENIDVLGNDSDPDGDPLTVTAATAPNGTVTINPDGTLNYTSDAGFVGDDTITYTIDDLISGTDTAEVIVTVSAPTPNDDPIAANDAVIATTDVLVEDIDVLGNDSDPDGDPLTVTAATSDNGGTVTINPDGTLDYTSPLGFEGTDLILHHRRWKWRLGRRHCARICA